MDTLTFKEIKNLKKKPLVDYAISIGIKANIKDPNIKFETVNKMTIKELYPAVLRHQANRTDTQYHRTIEQHALDTSVIPNSGVTRVEDFNAEADIVLARDGVDPVITFGGIIEAQAPTFRKFWTPELGNVRTAGFFLKKIKTNRLNKRGVLRDVRPDIYVSYHLPETLSNGTFQDNVFDEVWKRWDDKNQRSIGVPIVFDVEKKDNGKDQNRHYFTIVSEPVIPTNGWAGVPVCDGSLIGEENIDG